MNSFAAVPTTLAISLCLLLGGMASAGAQTAAPRASEATNTRELAAARADLARAARRVAELSRGTAGIASEVRIQRELIRKPVIGVLLAPDEQSGVRIAGVTPDGGAAKAGLKTGDRIVSVNGQQILGSNSQLRIANTRTLLGEAGRQIEPTKIGYARDGRTAIVGVTPQIDQHVFVWNGGDGGPMKAGSRMAAPQAESGVFAFDSGDFDFDFDTDAMAAGIAPEIRREIIRIGPDGKCKGDACRAPMLMSAFRWNGLNLASVDAQLGRYFGTDRGVLVLSNGELNGLQAGDVIQRIDGKPVANPREAMAALRGKPDGAKVAVDYLRDRKTGKTQVTVPKLMPLPIPPCAARTAGTTAPSCTESAHPRRRRHPTRRRSLQRHRSRDSRHRHRCRRHRPRRCASLRASTDRDRQGQRHAARRETGVSRNLSAGTSRVPPIARTTASILGIVDRLAGLHVVGLLEQRHDHRHAVDLRLQVHARRPRQQPVPARAHLRPVIAVSRSSRRRPA